MTAFPNDFVKVPNEFSDCILICNQGKSKFKTHKVILAARSEFFRREFQNSSVVHIPDLTREELQLVLDLIYTGQVKVDREDEENLADIVKRFQINSSPCQIKKAKLVDQSQPRLITHLPPEILVKILTNLSTRDLLQNVALISRQFYGLTKCPEVHLQVSVSNTFIDGEAIEFIKKAKLMTELKVTKLRDLRLKYPCEIVNYEDLDKALLATRNHKNLRSVFCTDINWFFNISPKTFILLSKSVWWKAIHKFGVDVNEKDVKKMSRNRATKKQFDDAVSSLGSDGNLSEFSWNVENPLIFFPSVHRLMTNPRNNKLKSLKINIECDKRKLIEIFGARKDSLEGLSVN